MRAKLQRLRDQVHALQRVARENPGAGAALPGILADLQLSLTRLHVDGAAPPASAESETSSATARPRPRPRPRQERLRAVAERAPLLVRVVGRGANCRWANHSWSVLTGRSPEQTRGEGWLQDVHPDDRARCAHGDRARCAHGDRARCEHGDAAASDEQDFLELEYRLRRAAGGFAWVHEHRVPRLTSRGAVAGYLATAVDVSQRKRSELHQDLVYAAERALAQDASVDVDATSILELLCRRLEWDVGELWSCGFAHEQPRCVKRWSSAKGTTIDMPASNGCVVAEWVADIAVDESFANSPEARDLALHGMLRLPVPMQGPGQASLRLYSRDVRARDDAVIAVAACVAARLGDALEHRVPTGEERSDTPREGLHAAVVMVDHEGHVIEFNAAAEALFGFPPTHALGRAFKDLVVPAREHKRFQERFEQQAARRHGRMSARFDSTALKADGSSFRAQFAMATLADREPPCITIFVWHNAARTPAEDAVIRYRARVQSLVGDLLLVEERERKRLARDLHDGLSQTIALAQIKVSALRASKIAALDGALSEVQELMEHADRAARSIGFELSPLVLHDLGLAPALEWLADNIQERYGITVDVKLENQDDRAIPLDETTSVIVFRAIRELVINAAKHAGAELVRVHLECWSGRLEILVSDEGGGIDPDTAFNEGGFGLLNVRERITHIGGQMAIDSIRGNGTKVRLSVPLKANEPNGSRTEV